MYVATQIGVKSNTYATWELGVRRPPLRMAMALATLYETPVEDLFPLEEAN
jgi:DNA-binding XRE family transcriptional regulator